MTEKMKPSGIVWIGDIPQDWKCKRYRFCGNVQYGYPFNSDYFSSEETGFPLIRIRDITSGEIATYYEGTYPSEYVVQSGDVLIGMDGDFNVRIWKNRDALLNQRCCRVFDSQQISKRFMAYYLPHYLKVINDLTWSTTVKHLLADDINNIYVSYPGMREQQSIADFLDSQCGKIDSVIADIEKQIELLKKYKLSIITEQTCPQDTTGWTKTKIKYIGDIRGRIGFRGYTVDDTVDPETPGCAVVLGGTNIMKDGTTNYEDLTYLSEEKYFESPEIMLWGGEILITKVGAGTGENSVYDGRFERATTNPNVMIYLPSKDVDSTFINYLLLSKMIKDDMKVESTKSGAQPAINQSYVKNLQIMLPSLVEQKRIAATLNRQCVIVDEIIEKKQQQLNSIQQHKKSLIYEYVTGKKRVTEVN